MQQPSQPKQTPNGRRQGGRTRNTPQQKAYASENDLPKYKNNRSAHPSTPQKSPGAFVALSTSSTNQKPRQKSGNKPRNKNGPASLGQDKPGHESPPLPSKPDSTLIFAGSSFHASPAPSALPIPSFLGRSDVDSGTKTLSSPEQEHSSVTTNSSEASPKSPPSIPRTEESPLEFIFRADRAEKAKTRRASSGQANPVTLSPFLPLYESPKECATFPKATAPNQVRRSNYSKRPTVFGGISSDELDGNPGQPVGPAFSTPFHERIRAARSTQNSAQTTPTAPRTHELNSSSDALKRYLFTGRLDSEEGRPQIQPVPTKQTPQQSPHHQAHQRPHRQQVSQPPPPPTRLPRGMFPASVLTAKAANAQNSQSFSPQAHAQLTSYRPEQLLAMEDGLRRMLKIDS
ncbi:hypothetical protein AAE478_003885 [Parahypoxylon ruwenzoriense]